MRTGLGAGEAEHAVAVVDQVGRMGAERATGGGQAFAIGGGTLEAGVGAAAAAAGAHLGPQFGDGELGKQAVHAAHRAEVAAPEALLEAQRTDHGAGGDQQQQATAQPGGVLQVAKLLPQQDQRKAARQQW